MGRIERIIENCTDCRYCKEFQDRHSNVDYAIICDYNEEDNTSGFMVARNHNKIIGYITVPIPENCPLPKAIYQDVKEVTIKNKNL